MKKIVIVSLLLLSMLLTGCAEDSATEVAIGIDYAHHKIHDGDSYSAWYEQTVSDTGDRTIIVFRTDNTPEWGHLTMTVSATASAHASIFQGPAVVDNSGASLNIYNRDNNSPNTSVMWDSSTNPDTQGQATYFTELTMGNVVGGAEIAHIHIQAGNKKTVGGIGRGTHEWILQQNTYYAFEIESENNDDNTHTITIDWFEHTNE